MSKIIAVANQKGGAGKTTLTQNLAAVLDELGLTVLMIDLDQQMSLSICWGYREHSPNLVDVLGIYGDSTTSLKSILVEVSPDAFPGLWLAPAHHRLSLVSIALKDRMGREAVLQRALRGHGNDVVLIDCPPALDMLTINALYAADYVLVPMVPETLNLEGLALIVRTIRELNEKLRKERPLKILSVVPNRCDMRLLEHRRVVEKLGRLVVAPVGIGNTIRVAEAQRERVPLIALDRSNPQTHAFYQLGEWVSGWLNGTSPN